MLEIEIQKKEQIEVIRKEAQEKEMEIEKLRLQNKLQ